MEDDLVNSTLRRVVKGAGIFLIGTFFGLFIGLISRVLVIRYITPYQFGILSFAWLIVSVVQTVFSFGIPNALIRQASVFIGCGETEKAKAVFKVSGYLLLGLSLLGTLLLILSADIIAKFFKMPDLGWVLRILAITVPFLILNFYLISIYQTFGMAHVKVMFGDVLPNVVKVSAIAVVILLGLSFYHVVWAYAVPPLIVSLAFVAYSINKIDLSTKESVGKYVKIIIAFAIPLLIQSILGTIIVWTDSFMIGYYLTPVDLALYNGARPLAMLLQQILIAVNFMYFPLASQLFGQRRMKEIGRTYAVVTKWLTSATLPAFLVMFLFPKTVLWVLYGSKYVDSYTVLRILALGSFIHILFGPNGMTLIIFGETGFVTLVNTIVAMTNFVLNLFLIPRFGIDGAAVASALVYIMSNNVVSLRLYTKYKIHPFTKNYIKPLVVSSVAVALIYSIAEKFKLGLVSLVVLFVIFVGVYFVSLLITKSFDKEDIMLLQAMEDRLGLNLSLIKKILRKFI